MCRFTKFFYLFWKRTKFSSEKIWKNMRIMRKLFDCIESYIGVDAFLYLWKHWVKLILKLIVLRITHVILVMTFEKHMKSLSSTTNHAPFFSLYK
jgi:uncharacterized membrane protein